MLKDKAYSLINDLFIDGKVFYNTSKIIPMLDTAMM